MIDLKQSVQYIKGVGPSRAKLLSLLGVNTVEDLINYYPRTYEDRTKIKKIEELQDGEDALIEAVTVTAATVFKLRRNMSVSKVMVQDDTGRCLITWFNQDYMRNVIHAHEKYRFFGKVTKKLGQIEMTSPVFDEEGKNKNTNEKHSAEVSVKVEDTTAPVITCEDTITVEQNEAFDINRYVSLNEEGTVTVTKNVDTTNTGTFITTIKAKDTVGNVSEKNITVNVEKNFYQRIADAALAQIGVYQDCTMLVTNSLAAVGINFHGAPAAYLSLGPLTNNPVPGDICVYQGHVALYIGNGQAVHGGWFGNQTTIYSVECNQPFIGYVHVNR